MERQQENMRKNYIRVGLIRMDTHTMYIGVLMQAHEPMLLRGPLPCRDGSFKHGWQAGGAYLYFYTTYREPDRMTIPKVEGFEVVKVWDEDRELAELAAKVFYSKPRVCDTLDEASDDVDLVVIGDCKTEGQDHVKLASPGLIKGVPTFIDKPFAYCLKDALAITGLSKKHHAPVLSLSIMRETPGLTHFRNRLVEIAPLNLGVIYGCAVVRLDGLIHAISAAQHVFGHGVKSVQCLSKDSDIDVAKLYYGDQPDKPAGGVLLTAQGGGGAGVSFSFHAAAIGKYGAIQSEPQNDDSHPYGMRRIVEKIRTMARTGKSPVPMSEMLENIAVADAIRKAYRTGRCASVEATEVP
ncbi:MAG: Gfo/Idh/MocA family oxidoreductase [Verrucomicrobia bacterium]|nr:Gfo/Idh/MocA family oxidoreductase [Verrucomicrobiota bacterium]